MRTKWCGRLDIELIELRERKPQRAPGVAAFSGSLIEVPDSGTCHELDRPLHHNLQVTISYKTAEMARHGLSKLTKAEKPFYFKSNILSFAC